MHRKASLLLLGLLLAACGVAGVGDAPTATYGSAVQTRLAGPGHTAIPTSTLRSGDKQPTVVRSTTTAGAEDATKTPFPTPTANPFADEFAPVLLGVADLPTGWTSVPVELTLESETTSEVCGLPVQDFAAVYVQAEFQKTITGPFASQGASLYATAVEADATLASLEAALRNCPVEGYDDGESLMLLTPVAFPQVGDRSFAFRLTLLIDDFAVEMDVVYAQVDRVLVTIGYGVLAGFGEAIDSTQTEDFIRRAEAKVRTMLDYVNSLQIPSNSV
jgi:hypothetical protein